MNRRLFSFGTALIALAAVFTVGCDHNGADANYASSRGNYQDEVPPPPPATADELAAQQEARKQEELAPEVAIGADETEYADTDPSALTEFKPTLEGHGTWVDDSSYGTVWVPNGAEVGSDFQPYVTAGHWTYDDTTDYVWVSDYEWGWAPFHYGRWVSLPDGRWAWIPGRRYAGAWVTWRVGPSGYGYVGWAPMAPDYYWSSGIAVGWTFGFYHPYDYYVYCPHNRFYGPVVSTYVVRGPGAHEHFGRTHDYVPASPAPSGGGRVIASPTVGGPSNNRVIASPTVSPRGSATHGPRPEEIGMQRDVVVAPPNSHAGLGRAQAMASPSTAVARGAAAPMQVHPATPAPAPRAAVASAFRPTPSVGGGSPRVASSPSISRPRSPSSSAYRGFSSSASPRVSSSPSFSPRPSASPRVSSPAPMRSSPSVSHSSPSPSMHSSPSPSFRSAAPSVSHSAPVRSASPSVGRSSPSPSVSHSVRAGSSGKKR